MIVFSTVLEVDGRPTLYSVYKNRSLAFFNPDRQVKAPILFATLNNSDWLIKGTEDTHLVSQVIREVNSI